MSKKKIVKEENFLTDLEESNLVGIYIFLIMRDG